MRRASLIGALLIALVVAGSATYVFAAAVPKLRSVRSVLSGDPSDLGSSRLREAAADLAGARRALNSVPGRILRIVPVARQNVRAIDALAADAGDVLSDARRLRRVVDATGARGLTQRGSVRMQALDDLRLALGAQTASLSDLEETVRARRSGWMLPPVWDAFEAVHERVAPLDAAAERAHAALRLAPEMLGGSGRRRYLALLINNAELRGAGGILSGVGTLSVDDGEVTLGRFDYYADLAAPSSGLVDQPPDLRRRFGRYLRVGPWINATASPDLPEVAEYVAGLYEGATGVRTDGAVIIDPRGLAALLSPGETIAAPGSGEKLTSSELPRYVYSDAYAIFGAESGRRSALLSLGPALLRRALHGGFERDELERLGEAVRGGHVRVVSFDPRERAALERLEVSGDLQDEDGSADQVLVTVQNLGADKLDYWVRRSIAHDCRIEDAGRAICTTTVELRNRTPGGLPPYVVQETKRYGTYKGYIEVYVPRKAHVTTVSLDGVSPKVYTEREDGRLSLGTNFSLPQGRTTVATVAYELPLRDGRYSLEIAPQPLVHDAGLEVALSAPDGWVIEGPEGEREEELRYRGRFDGTVELSAGPSQGPPGITGAWESLRDFWNRPLFRL